jgi:hypothetical protein
MLDDRNNQIFLHENEFNSSVERDSIVLPSNMAAFTSSCTQSVLKTRLAKHCGSDNLFKAFE